MRRREFCKVIGASAALWPLAARAQIARIGFLGATFASGYAAQVEAFRSGLRDLGYIEGSNIALEYRWANGKYGLLPALAAELLRSKVDVIVTHGTPATLAAKGATTAIPIVMVQAAAPAVPALSNWLFATLVVDAIIVALLTYVFMPRVTRLLSKWLFA